MGHWPIETLLPRRTPHSDSDRSRAIATSPKPDFCYQQSLCWLSILQGYNVDIRNIPGKKNLADSLSRQLIVDALVKKGSIKDTVVVRD